VVGERPQSTRVRKPVMKFGAKAPEPKQPVLEEQSEDEYDNSPSDQSDEFASPNASPPESGSEDEVEDNLDPSREEEEASLANLCREGGTQVIKFLLSKAVSPTKSSTPTKPPKEWSYHDIACLPEAERNQWRTACDEELEALRRRNVYNLVEQPHDRKVIKNQWIFNVKTDG